MFVSARRRAMTVVTVTVAAASLAAVGALAVPTAASGDEAPLAYSVTDRFHAVYALPSDVAADPAGLDADLEPAAMTPRIQHEMKLVRDWFASQTGGRRPRFVLGPDGVEVTVATIPITTTEIATSGWNGHERIRALLVQQGVLGANEMGVIYVPSDGPACGATTPESRGRPAFSVLYMDACGIYPSSSSSFPFGATYLAAHEMTHALGAVPQCAPNADGTGHVRGDPRDVLNNGGRDWFDLQLDPGHDDYYGHGRPGCTDIAAHPAWLPAGAGGCDGADATTVVVPTSASGPAAAAGQGFVGVGPTRLFDTRQALSGPVCPGQTVVAQVAGRAGVPESGATAVVLNVTVTDNPEAGYLSVWPADQPRPNSSSVNFSRGQTTANLVVSALSADGRIALWNSDDAAAMDAAHVAVDVVGYLEASSGYAGFAPTRVLDTRAGIGAPVTAVAAGGEIALQLTGRDPIPASEVVAVALNVTVADAAADGYVTVWPDGQLRPNVSSVNFAAGQSRANLVIVPVGPGGAVRLWNSNDATTMRPVSLIADAVGYFTAGGSYHAVSPQRIADTRFDIGADGPLQPGGERELAVTGLAGVPVGAVAVSVNITATRTAGPGYLTTWPSGSARPGTSTLNWQAGQTIANAAIASVGADGRLRIWNAADSPEHRDVDVIVDVFGYVAPA